MAIEQQPVEPNYDEIYGEAGSPDWGSSEGTYTSVSSEAVVGRIAGLGAVWYDMSPARQREARHLFNMGFTLPAIKR